MAPIIVVSWGRVAVACAGCEWQLVGKECCSDEGKDGLECCHAPAAEDSSFCYMRQRTGTLQ